jgi:hypothetical protein
MRTKCVRQYLKRSRLLFVMGLSCFVSHIAPPSCAQANSNTANVVLTATLLESITVVAVPNTVLFNLAAGGVANGSTPVSITTVWILGPTRTSLKLYGSFDSASAALTDGGGDNIPSANVLGQVTTGSPINFTAFTQTTPFGAAGAGLLLFSQPISITNTTGTRTDNLSLEIDLTSLSLPAGAYVGTLHIQAQAL